MHVTLAWEPGQRPQREEMSAFARRAIAALKAEDRQAAIFCHTDTKHPHVHVVINRVSPKDGRMLSSSNEKLALSELALAYEREGGKILCKEREINAGRRAKGEFVRGKKDIPRKQFEALQEGRKEAEKEIPAQLEKQDRQAAEDLRTAIDIRLRAKLEAAREELRPAWRDLYQRQRGEAEQDQQQKTSVLDRLRGWIKGKDKTGSPALPFQLQTLKDTAVAEQTRADKQRRERAALSKNYKAEIRKVFGEIRTACRQAADTFMARLDKSGIGQFFRPAASPGGSGPAPAPQTDKERKLSELSEKFRKKAGSEPEPQPPTPPQRDHDKDREPG